MEKKLRVLCLHGYRQDADKFRQQTGALRKVLKKYAELEYITAPLLVPNESATSRSWWFTEHQSFSSRDQTDGCTGLEESIKLVETTWADKGPFDGLLGFSQGACLVGLLAAMCEQKQLSFRPQFLVIISGFMSQCKPHQSLYVNKINLPSLHVLGEVDEVIPCQWGEALALTFCNPTILRHQGGHFVGGTTTNKSEYQQFFELQRQSLVHSINS